MPRKLRVIEVVMVGQHPTHPGRMRQAVELAEADLPGGRRRVALLCLFELKGVADSDSFEVSLRYGTALWVER
jgi:hypothetical protein